MWEAPVVKEMREIRHEIEAECGNDFEEIAASAIEIQKRHGDKVISKLSRMNEQTETVSADRA